MNAKANDKKAPAIEVTCHKSDTMENISLPLGSLTLEFSNGKQLALNVGDLSPEILGQAICHGLKQKLVDAAAISRDPETGRSATIDTKYHAVNDVLTRLLAGDWNKRREGGGNQGGLLFRALVRMYDGKKTPEQLKEWLDGKTDAQKAAMRKHPDIAKVIDEIRAESGEENNGADLLAELDGE